MYYADLLDRSPVREVWSTEEEVHLCPGHFWICKFGTVPGSMSCVEKKFDLQTRKWEEYKVTRYYDGDKDLVVELWLDRCATDFHLVTVRSLQLDVVVRRDRCTHSVTVRKRQGVGNSTFVLPVENDDDFRSRCE